jgi:hypothetical protein
MARMHTFTTRAGGASMKKLTLVLCLCLVPVVSPRSDVVTTMGVGANSSCGKWLDARRTGRYFDMANWALGYISGAAIWGAGDPLGQTDADGVAYWLDNYCQAKPTSYFSDAVKAFISDAAKTTSRPSADVGEQRPVRQPPGAETTA